MRFFVNVPNLLRSLARWRAELHVAKTAVKKTRRRRPRKQPKRWRWAQGWDLGIVTAHTKSEARAEFKRLAGGLRRLPVGAAVFCV